MISVRVEPTYSVALLTHVDRRCLYHRRELAKPWNVQGGPSDVDQGGPSDIDGDLDTDTTAVVASTSVIQ